MSTEIKHVIILLLLVCSSPGVRSQFRGQEPRPPAVSETIQAAPVTGLLFGLINPENVHMSHSISMGYASEGGEGLGMSMYTNSIRYQISEPLSVRADVSLMMTRFGSLSSKMGDSFGGIFLNNAEIRYRPSKDFGISLQFTQDPYRGALSPRGSLYGTPFSSFPRWDADDR